MASTQEKDAGLPVRPLFPLTTSSNTVLATIEDAESVHSMTPLDSDEKYRLERETSPYSAFYNHDRQAPTQTSLDAPKNSMTRYPTASAYDTDLEAALDHQRTLACSSQQTLASTASYVKKSASANPHCTVWPGQQALKQKKRAMNQERLNRSTCGLCGFLGRYSKRTQLYIELAIAVVVVGAIVGIAVGISRAVGGGINRNQGVNQ